MFASHFSWSKQVGQAVTTLGLAWGLAYGGVASADEFIIKIKPQEGNAKATFFALKDLAPMRILDSHDIGNLLKVDITAASKQELMESVIRLKNAAEVEYITPNINMHAFSPEVTPNDPRFAEQWALKKVNAEKAWDISTGSEIVVAVVDTGVDYRHPDLSANMWKNADEIAGNKVDDDNNGFVDDVSGWDFAENDNDPTDKTSQQNPGHGTHCAGIIGAVGNNNEGVSGINHQVKIMPVRFLNENGQGDLMVSAKAIDYAVANGAKIISASWGAAVSESMVKPIVEAIDRAAKAGVMFVVAAANDGKDNDARAVFPANTNLPNVISVAATDSDDKKPEWSNFGLGKVHVGAPGHKILSTLPEKKYGELSGTSMATPLVAGTAALILAGANQAVDGWTMRALLQGTGTKMELEVACHCRIDVEKALTTVTQKKMFVVPNALTLAKDGTVNIGAFGGSGAKTFSIANPQVAKIDAQGQLTALANGETTVSVTDASGQTATSGVIRVAEQKEEVGLCPLEDPFACLLLCIVDPNQPWCKDLPGLPDLPPGP